MSMETLLEEKATWRSGFSRAMIPSTNKDFRIPLRSYRPQATKITYVLMILQKPDQRGSLILFPGNLLGTRMRPSFGKEMRHHCLLHGPSSTQGSSVPYLKAWSCTLRVMKACQATRILSPRGQINLPLGSRWTLMSSWYIIWSMFKELPQTFARHQKGGLLHLLRQTVSAKTVTNRSLVQKRLSIYNWNPGHRRGKKMLSRSRLQASGMM